jgi:hypothetical protein
MTDTRTEETSPDQLLESFRGRSLKSIIVFTVVVHFVVLTGASIPFLWKSVAGEDHSKLSENERVEIAVREATASLRDIAEKHGLKPQDLGERFASGRPSKAEPTKVPESADAVAPEEPKSTMEKELQTKEAGPELPSFENEKEDLFK